MQKLVKRAFILQLMNKKTQVVSINAAAHLIIMYKVKVDPKDMVSEFS